ncbi:MAG: hypothetical protein A2665_00075 [Candidatus Zambryskibacteria bacterium RIFCSPHIGHO2_01_FULL_46_30]|uniref:Uncharacterized protein n=1 Tax=Candidatus Zambryskibacteria bacterium RIFCSPHIGHO2_01_FULL_46_30 TaxID=1802739 RepID=A0A1G2T1I2_9BACT|nr:MAG: hypothetical protein A2665_00075 [Candidatus Zambryskibacteria bacterium RIFCSPHIGHO2_01_FULL_46_30]OHB05377.1 MAG: hypothetical protein A3B22_01440 [Candidatus Zambryskibacteria bacterium RIFCSPLOWO2_01_FULL_47_33]
MLLTSVTAFPIYCENATAKFTRVKVRNLGFTKNPVTTQIWARIRELGHLPCELGDGSAIRIALKDQPLGDYFWIIMEQVTVSGRRPKVFLAVCLGFGQSWLRASRANLGVEWSLDNEIVFRLRK